jgi:hypothetical protein
MSFMKIILHKIIKRCFSNLHYNQVDQNYDINELTNIDIRRPHRDAYPVAYKNW